MNNKNHNNKMTLTRMEVIKRNGSRERVSFDKIIRRIEGICEKLMLKRIDPIDISKDTIQGIYNGITTEELDFFAAQKCAEKIIDDPEYNNLAAGLCVSSLHKSTSSDFMEVTEKLFRNTDSEGKSASLVTQEYYNAVKNNINRINAMIDYERDYLFDFFAIKTLERAYLIRIKNDKKEITNSEPNNKKNKSSKKEKTMLKKYGRIIERPQHMIMRVAIGIHFNDMDSVKETYDLISQQFFTHASPTLYNAGSLYPQLSSCFLLHMGDSIEGIFKTLTNSAYISKRAGGIGIHISEIRAKGSIIKGTNGTSDGIVPLARHVNTLARYINQGGRRNGAISLYAEPWHPDIYDFCDLKKETGAEELRARDVFLALWIPDLFMKRVAERGKWSLMCPNECKGLVDSYGDKFEELYIQYENEEKYVRQVNAEDLWFHILEAQTETGTPYMLYKDHCNNKSNQKNLGTIRSSNLCVTGDTKILTDEGHKEIITLVGQKVKIWNGRTWSNVIVNKTGINKELLQITFSNGVTLKCTPEHRFYLQTTYGSKKYIKKEAHELIKNDKLLKWKLPHSIEINNKDEFKYPYTHGFFCGDGTTFDNYAKTKKYPKLYLYGEKKQLLDYIAKDSWTINVDCDRYDIILPKDIAKKFIIPFNTSLETRLKWFEGYCDADGTIAVNNTNESLQITSTEFDFLSSIRLMLQTMGVESKVTLNKKERYELLPDGKNGLKKYRCKEIWRLLISSNGLYHLHTLGFSPKRLKFNARNPQRNAEQFVRVESVIKLDAKEDTYCFTEFDRHMGMFNGILAGQCAEIIEYSDDEETAVCNLASICLHRFIETDPETNELFYNFDKLCQVAQVVTKNLDKIIDINHYPTPEAERSNMRHRPIGVGVQGLADVYCILDLPFDSEEAQILNKKIFETIYYGCVKASNELAKTKGRYQTFEGSPFSEGKLQYHLWGLTEKDLLMNWDWLGLIESIKKHGMRNSLLTALMPTASTSQIMNSNECFEPFTSNLYTRTTLAGEYVIVNKYLVEKLISMGLWTKQVKDEFIYDNGSIQNIASIPDEIKDIFKTGYEMRTKPVLDQAIGRGPFIDQSQSMNIFSNEADFDSLTSSHFYGWENGLKTGMYYLRSKAAINAIKFGLDPEVIRKIEKKRKKLDKLNQDYDNENISYQDSEDHSFDSESDSDDPRRINEIDEHLNTNSQKKTRADMYKSCDMCSG